MLVITHRADYSIVVSSFRKHRYRLLSLPLGAYQLVEQSGWHDMLIAVLLLEFYKSIDVSLTSDVRFRNVWGASGIQEGDTPTLSSPCSVLRHSSGITGILFITVTIEDLQALLGTNKSLSTQ